MKVAITYEATPSGARDAYDPDLGLNSLNLSTKPLSDLVTVTEAPATFAMTIGRNPQNVFTTEKMQLAFSEFFTRFGLSMTYDTVTPGIWGLGDHYSTDLFVGDGIYSQWNRDAADPKETGKLPASNTYGSHPFFVFKTKTSFELESQAYYGVFMKNVNAADFVVKTDKTKGTIDYQATTTGG